MSIFNGKMKNFDKDAPGAQADRVKFRDMIGGFLAPQAYANQGNMKLAEYQYSKDLEMWNRQNEYNSPVAQMARFAEAGLNPNLVATQGNSGNATQMPHYNAPTMSFDQKIPLVTNILQTFADLDMKQAAADKVKEETNAQRITNSMLAVQNEFYRERQITELGNLISSGAISQVEGARRIRELLQDYGTHIMPDRSGKYSIVETDDEGYAIKRKKLELDRFDLDIQLENLRKTINQKVLDYFDANQIMRLLGSAIGIFK